LTDLILFVREVDKNDISGFALEEVGHSHDHRAPFDPRPTVFFVVIKIIGHIKTFDLGHNVSSLCMLMTWCLFILGCESLILRVRSETDDSA
jgi:hypothetical protein